MKEDYRAGTDIGGSGGDTVVDGLKLAFDYHRHLAAGILALGGFLSPSTSTQYDDISPPLKQAKYEHGMVIGLGGGALVNFFMAFMPNLNLTIVELDECIVDIAKSHFGFRADSDRVKVVIGDGLAICAENKIGSIDLEKEERVGSEKDVAYVSRDGKGTEFAPNSMQFIVIDVDSKDTSIGMSCPPVPFISPTYLAELYELLRSDGVLAINVSARDPSMLHAVKKNVYQVFKTVFLSNTDVEPTDEDIGGVVEDLNVVVFCTKNKIILPDADHCSNLLSNLCLANTVKDDEIVLELEDCIVGIKQFYVPMKTEVDNSPKYGTKQSSNPTRSSRGKKKGNNKKKRGKKK